MNSVGQQSGSALDRYTPIGELANAANWLLTRSLLVFGSALACAVGVMLTTDTPGVGGFAWLAFGVVVALGIWRGQGVGLPLLPLLVLQHLVVYGVPILARNTTVSAYSEDLITRAGGALFIFLLTLAAGWKLGMTLFIPKKPWAYALQSMALRDAKGLIRVGLCLIVSTFIYTVAVGLGWVSVLFSLLPSGTYSVLNALSAAIAACGFFLGALYVTTDQMLQWQKTAFWSLLIINCLLLAASFLISSTATIVASVAIGLFWATGRIPWRYLVIAVSVISFLNLGKFTMRERYWPKNGDTSDINYTIFDLPRHYAEWSVASVDSLFPEESGTGGAILIQPNTSSKQSLLDRVNNLQNLLFVLDATENQHIPTVGGSTYFIIPPLLVPRILWPEKPRTHEGQILLNVHFGRQDRKASYQTYIAWGLLPEACGNFGAWLGPIFLGLVLGVGFAWIECATARMPLLSMEGFVSFTLLLAVANSYEMVASVAVTSIFQSLVTVVAASLPFVKRQWMERPSAPAP